MSFTCGYSTCRSHCASIKNTASGGTIPHRNCLCEELSLAKSSCLRRIVSAWNLLCSLRDILSPWNCLVCEELRGNFSARNCICEEFSLWEIVWNLLCFCEELSLGGIISASYSSTSVREKLSWYPHLH